MQLSITKEQAVDLTSRIKTSANNLWQLLTEAHEKKAWAALGYKGWGDYVKKEFDMSRGHSYRLINQGSVIKELEKVSPNETLSARISESDARRIKPHLDQITEAIKSGEPIEDAVFRVVSEDAENDADYDPAENEIEELRDAIQHLAEENEKLRDGQIVEALDEGEKMTASELIESLRKRIKSLEMELESVKRSRDHYQAENGQMKRQMAMQRKEITQLRVV